MLARAHRDHQAGVRPGDHQDLREARPLPEPGARCPAAEADQGTVRDPAARQRGGRIQPGTVKPQIGHPARPGSTGPAAPITQPGQGRREISDAVPRFGGNGTISFEWWHWGRGRFAHVSNADLELHNQPP